MRALQDYRNQELQIQAAREQAMAHEQLTREGLIQAQTGEANSRTHKTDAETSGVELDNKQKQGLIDAMDRAAKAFKNPDYYTKLPNGKEQFNLSGVQEVMGDLATSGKSSTDVANSASKMMDVFNSVGANSAATNHDMSDSQQAQVKYLQKQVEAAQAAARQNAADMAAENTHATPNGVKLQMLGAKARAIQNQLESANNELTSVWGQHNLAPSVPAADGSQPAPPDTGLPDGSTQTQSTNAPVAAPAQSNAADADALVSIINPKGARVKIKQSQLADALNQGYKQQ